MYHRVKSQQGFTIIELMVAMAFISILLLIIAMTVIQISGIYNKGLTMRAVDQAGRSISSDIRHTLSSSQPFIVDSSLCLQTSNGGCTKNVEDAVAGRLCLGSYSYIWNYGKSLNDNPPNTYKPGSDPTDRSGANQIRFIRVRDSGGQYCADPRSQDIIESDATELLSQTSGIAVHKLQISQIASDPTIGEALYRVIIDMGTDSRDSVQQIKTLDTLDTSCRPPSDNSSAQDFCAINQIDFTAEAGNRGGLQ